jgi:hypothetical protein
MVLPESGWWQVADVSSLEVVIAHALLDRHVVARPLNADEFAEVKFASLLPSTYTIHPQVHEVQKMHNFLH